MPSPPASPPETWSRLERLHEIIFEADTPAGKAFDVALLISILLSVGAVILDSVPEIHARHARLLLVTEWFFTILFTIEYLLRLLCVTRKWRYALSFFGIVDLLAVLPTYMSLLTMFAGSQALLVIRALRLLRVFRILKLVQLLSEARSLRQALWASRAKVTVFLTTVIIVVMIMGAAMHLVEGRTGHFESIPHSMYWAIVTMTTVGYGDVTPETVPGKFLACVIMILGYSFIIIPTGIIGAELASTMSAAQITTRSCRACTREGHARDAVYCKYCGESL